MLISVYAENFKWLVSKYKVRSYLIFVLPFVLIAVCHLRGNDFIYNVFACLFMAFVVRVMFYHLIDNRLLFYLGRHCFSIYILQRIPMTIIHYYLGENCSHYLFLILSLFATLGIAYCFDRFTEKLDTLVRL